VHLFGPDDCYGVAWTLLHLIESAPGWPLHDCLQDIRNEWTERLRLRAERQQARLSYGTVSVYKTTGEALAMVSMRTTRPFVFHADCFVAISKVSP
jgi:hypothetical protein